MKQYILLLFIMIPLLSYGKTDMEKLLERVDHAIEMDSYYQQQKEKELKRLRRQAGDAITDEERLCYLDSLYRAYSNYRYDSSCAYVSKGLQLAEATHNTFYITCFKIHRASVLSVGGFYDKAEGILATLDLSKCPTNRSCITTLPMPGCSITGNLTQPNRNLQTTSKPRRSII